MSSKNQAYPFILVENSETYKVVFLDVILLSTISFNTALLMLMAVYIVFFIPFVPEAACTLQFVQKCILKIPITEHNVILSAKAKHGKTLTRVANLEMLLEGQKEIGNKLVAPRKKPLPSKKKIIPSKNLKNQQKGEKIIEIESTDNLVAIPNSLVMPSSDKEESQENSKSQEEVVVRKKSARTSGKKSNLKRKLQETDEETESSTSNKKPFVRGRGRKPKSQSKFIFHFRYYKIFI